MAKTQPTIALNCSRDLLAGLAQTVELVISSGSVRINEGSTLKLRTSRGLTVSKTEECKNGQSAATLREIEVIVPPCEPFETSRLKLTMFAELPPKRDSSSMEHKVATDLSYNHLNLKLSVEIRKHLHTIIFFNWESLDFSELSLCLQKLCTISQIY